MCVDDECNLEKTSVINCTGHPIMHRTPNTIIRGCVLVPNAIRSMGSFIDGFQDMEIRVSMKINLIHVVVVIRVEKNTWSKTLYYLFLILNRNLYASKSGSFCFGLLYLSKSI